MYPPNFNEIYVDVRQPKKPVIIEGPSGTGKTVTVRKIQEKLRGHVAVEYFTSRNPERVEIILRLAEAPRAGHFVIDDFHRLSANLQAELGSLAKRAADGSGGSTLPKLILIGINQVGSMLIELNPDIAKRVGVHRISEADLQRTSELITKGSKILNVIIPEHDKIFAESRGDHWLTQSLCTFICTQSGITETVGSFRHLPVDIQAVRARLIASLDGAHRPAVIEFCKGTRFRPSRDAFFRALRAIAKKVI